jgi:hypothetical protein
MAILTGVSWFPSVPSGKASRHRFQMDHDPFDRVSCSLRTSHVTVEPYALEVMKCLKKQSIFNPVSSFYCSFTYRQTDRHHLLLYKDDIWLFRAAAGVVILTSGSKWRHEMGDKISQDISVYQLKRSLSMIYWLHLGKYTTSYFVRGVLMIPGRRADDIVAA